MQNIITKTSDTSVSKTLKFPIGQRPEYGIRLKPMSFVTWSLVCATEISSITQTKFNDGNTSFIINIAHIGQKNEKRFEMYRANLIFKVKKDGVLQMVNNGKLVTASPILSSYLVLFNNVGRYFKEVFDEYQSNGYNLYDYHFSRNQKLFQLPCTRDFLESFYFSLTQNNRNRVNYHLRKGNTHKATIALLGYDFPKSIKKLLLSNTKYSSYRYSLGCALQAGIPVDTVRNLILQERFQLVRLLAKKPTLTGWSLKETKEMPDHDSDDFLIIIPEYPSETLARDTLRMIENNGWLEALPDTDITHMSNNLRQFHDQLIPIYNRLIDDTKAQDWASKYKYHSSEYDVAEVDGYVIRPVVSSNECSSIGFDMGICVGDYSTDHNQGKLEILVVTDNKGKYLACLELRDYTLVQAKLKYNKQVFSDKEIHLAVVKYCDQFGIKISTRDVV